MWLECGISEQRRYWIVREGSLKRDQFAPLQLYNQIRKQIGEHRNIVTETFRSRSERCGLGLLIS